MIPLPVNNGWPMPNSGSMHSRTMFGVPLLSTPPVHFGSSPVSPAGPFTNMKAVKRVKYLVIFDWDDTLFPTTAIRINEGKDISVSELLKLGQSVYKLLEEYIASFGAKNLCIVTNGVQSWVSDSLKMLSDVCKAYFEEMNEEMEQKERDQDCFAAIQNTLISEYSIPVISARDEFSVRYPQVKCHCHKQTYQCSRHSVNICTSFNICTSATGNMEDKHVQIDREDPL